MTMSAYSLDVNGENFQRVVIDGSKKTPVLVDFWAEWCGPCRMLKPILEKLAEEYRGKFVLAKVNTEANYELSARYGIRGIPNVKAFVDGELVDEFSGALPESAVREFIDRLIPSPAEELRAKAQEAVGQGDTAKALQMLAEASKLDPPNEWVRVDAAEIMLNMGELEEAKRLLEALSPAVRTEARVVQLAARLQFSELTQDGGGVAELERRIADDEADLGARMKLANLLIARQQYAAGMDQLLEVIRRDRNFDDEAARKAMLSVFNLLGGQGELVSRYRRLLARALN
jgi:putative thioredoxin